MPPVCAQGSGTLDPTHDYHSYANPQQYVTTHIDLDLNVDFPHKSLAGTARLSIKQLNGNGDLVLDTRDLTINAVEAGPASHLKHVVFRLDKRDPILGSALHIALPADADTVLIHYRTQAKSSALQWLTPAQTAGKKHPFLFTQSEAIHARSWIPLQDSPQVRITYNAHIHTPADLRAVMSANNDGNSKRNGDYHFTMPQAISSYLIALAVGDLEFKAMSERTGVYAEPVTLNRAVKEFDDTEKMVKTTELLYGAYAWGRYDLLILPPSFPFGGMENPRLSFITPTVLAGDKSLVSMIAHELAHSWSGNTVTNATWRDLWLNEGFTSYVENRIMEALYGRDEAVMEQVLSLKSLNDDLAGAAPADRVLAVDIRGRDPDDVFSDIPYVKGAMFLTYLEQRFGREKFDEFLHGYFDHFRMQTLTSEDFINYLQAHLIDRNPGIVTQEKIHEWIYAQGLPSDAPEPHSQAFDHVEMVAAQFLADADTLKNVDTHQWVTQEWLDFLDHLPATLSKAQLTALDNAFHFTQTGNSEIAMRWLTMTSQANYLPARKATEQFLMNIGRRRLIDPIYDALIKTSEGKSFARQVYQRARSGYHPMAQARVDKLLNFHAN